MRRLFDDQDRFTDDANRIGRDVMEVVEPIVRREFGAGFSARDILLVIENEVGALVSQLLLRQAIAAARAGQVQAKFRQDGEE